MIYFSIYYSSRNCCIYSRMLALEKYLSEENELPLVEKMIMRVHFWLKETSLSAERGFDLDMSNLTVKKFPLVVSSLNMPKLKRVED